MKKFVTYLTTYSGNLLPQFYIGSTSEKNALSGKYFGSVKSKKWKTIFKNELKINIHHFKLKILSSHDDRESAITEELRLQRLHNVVKSPEYINESLACPNGMFGRFIKGKDHPMYGLKHSDETKKKISKNKKGQFHLQSEETKNKISKARKGMKFSDEHKKNISKGVMGNKNRLGIKHSEETKQKLSILNKGRIPWHKGKKVSEANKQIFINNFKGRMKGKKHSEKTKLKMSISRKEYFQRLKDLKI